MKLKLFIAGLVTTFALLLTSNTEDIKVSAANTNNTYIEANQLENLSKKYLGIRYRSGGTTTAGFDCSGYVQFVYRQLGIELPRTSSGMFDTGTGVAKADLQAGDLVFFKTTSAKVGHVGIYIGNGNFIHASTSRGVIVTKLNDPYYWGSRYVGAKRVAAFQ